MFLSQNILLNFFQLSSFIGQVLVKKLISVYDCTYEAAKLTCSFFQILYEDSLIFLQDAKEKFMFATYLMKELYLYLEAVGWNMLKTFFIIVENIFSLLQFIQETIVTFKQGIHLTGSIIWGFFIYLPETVVSIIYGIYIFLSNNFIEIITFMTKVHKYVIEKSKTFYLFIFDVPLDSVFGLLIGTLLLFIFYIKFLDICYFLISILKKIQQQVTLFGTSLWSGRFLEHRRRNINNYDDDDDNDERFCIICQYEYKEIIIFPCKHLCLCRHCSKELVKSQPRCPICRGNITGILKVYF